MYAIKLEKYVLLGQNTQGLHAITYIASKAAVPQTKFKVVYSYLRRIMTIIYTEQLSDDLHKEIKAHTIALHKRYSDQETIFSKSDAEVLLGKIVQWQRSLLGEIKYISCYNFEYDSNINIAKIEQDGVRSMYGENIWRHLESMVQKDLEESSKCLVFECPTASAILALRAAEGVLRSFHSKKINPINLKGPKTWGELIQDLEKSSVNVNLLYHLKYIKNEHRNPLNHPEVTLSQDEAETIFFLVKQVITEMIKATIV